MTYQEQLQNPKWIEKRKAILRRDKKCQRCGSTEHLEVHHLSYDFTKKSWEYPDDNFIVLCKKCHKKETKDIRKLRAVINDMLKSGFFASEIMDKIDLIFKDFK